MHPVYNGQNMTSIAPAYQAPPGVSGYYGRTLGGYRPTVGQLDKSTLLINYLNQLLAPLKAAWPKPQTVTMWRHCHGGGRGRNYSNQFSPGVYSCTGSGGRCGSWMSNEYSRILVPSGTRAYVWRQPNFGGDMRIISPTDSCMHDWGWGDSGAPESMVVAPDVDFDKVINSTLSKIIALTTPQYDCLITTDNFSAGIIKLPNGQQVQNPLQALYAYLDRVASVFGASPLATKYRTQKQEVKDRIYQNLLSSSNQAACAKLKQPAAQQRPSGDLSRNTTDPNAALKILVALANEIIGCAWPAGFFTHKTAGGGTNTTSLQREATLYVQRSAAKEDAYGIIRNWMTTNKANLKPFFNCQAAAQQQAQQQQKFAQNTTNFAQAQKNVRELFTAIFNCEPSAAHINYEAGLWVQRSAAKPPQDAWAALNASYRKDPATYKKYCVAAAQQQQPAVPEQCPRGTFKAADDYASDAFRRAGWSEIRPGCFGRQCPEGSFRAQTGAAEAAFKNAGWYEVAAGCYGPEAPKAVAPPSAPTRSAAAAAKPKPKKRRKAKSFRGSFIRPLTREQFAAMAKSRGLVGNYYLNNPTIGGYYYDYPTVGGGCGYDDEVGSGCQW